MESTEYKMHAGLEFIKTSANSVSKLSFEQLLYISRDKNFLKESLQQAPTDLIVAKGIEVIIPALEKISTKQALSTRSTYAQNDMNKAEAIDVIKEDIFSAQCSESVECIAAAYKFLCPLTKQEVIYILGLEVALSMAFTLAQVRHLAQEQNHPGRTGPLVFEWGNYFLIRGRNNTIRLMQLWWRDGVRNRWHFWFPKGNNGDKQMPTEATFIGRHEKSTI